ncbi:hypothetical protein BCR35DRAFT_331531 [Leucosporidium creatinivorum]|uniref:Uncharacterized protein n=1 Tax=Leucosporidium creatinivorum TaxID=106004 RepID=A0A1Y2FCX5_9BASI|nr:hypothetical protein BCR35DRAFT_331531 [Leucosporidium creatinivorum]
MTSTVLPAPTASLRAGIPWPDGHITDSVYFPTMFGVLLTGVILSMTATYVSRWIYKARDRWLHYALLAVMVPCFIVKTCLDIEFVRDVIVDDASTQLGAELIVSLAMAFICIFSSQMWLVYRVHVLSERYWPFTAIGIVTLLASFVSFVGLRATKRSNWTVFLEPAFHSWFIAYATTTALSDVYLSTVYIISVVKLGKKSPDPRFKRLLSFMLAVAVQSFVPTAALSIALFISIFSAFLSLLPALNCISVLYTLNTRTQSHKEEVTSAQSLNVAPATLESGTRPTSFRHSPSSSVSQATTVNSPIYPWSLVAVEKSVEISEESESPPRERVLSMHQIPRKEPPRFEG